MSAQQLIEKLKALSLAHEAIAGTQGLVKKHLEQVKQKEAALATLASRLASLDSELKQAQKNIDEIDLDLSSIQDQENKLQKKLKTLKKQKEIVALEKELAILARKRYDQERALEAAWNTLTNLKQGHAPARSKIQQEENLVKTELTASNKTETSLKNKLTSGEQIWNDALSKIPEEWQTRYTRMLNSVPNPIVAINNSVCGACFYTIVEKDMHKIKAGEILACRSCYRLLYNSEQCSKIEASEQQAAY